MKGNYDVLMRVRLIKDDELIGFEKLNITLEEAYKLIDKYRLKAFKRGVYEFQAQLWYRPERFSVVKTVFYVHAIPGEIK